MALKIAPFVLQAYTRFGGKMSEGDLEGFVEQAKVPLAEVIKTYEGDKPNERKRNESIRHDLVLLVGVCNAFINAGQADSFINDTAAKLTELLDKHRDPQG